MSPASRFSLYPTIIGQGIPRPLGMFLTPPPPWILNPSGNSKAQNRELSHHTMAIWKWQGTAKNHGQNPTKPCHQQQKNQIPTCTYHACQNQLGNHTCNMLPASTPTEACLFQPFLS